MNQFIRTESSRLCSNYEDSQSEGCSIVDLGAQFQRCRSQADSIASFTSFASFEAAANTHHRSMALRRRSLAAPPVEASESVPDPSVYAIIPGILSFCANPSDTDSSAGNYKFVSTKLPQMYQPKFFDFGPVGLPVVLRFCSKMRERLQRNAGRRHQVVCCGSDAKECANAYFLLASFLVLEMNWSPRRACEPFEQSGVTIVPFRDASKNTVDFTLSLEDCIEGLWKAKQTGFLDVAKLPRCSGQGGKSVLDFNRICPKLVAFSRPLPGEGEGSAQAYAAALASMGVGTVVQLNEEKYTTAWFTQRGIRHVSLPFADGRAPGAALLERFLSICDSASGAVGVHCMAGLGRTGTMIGAWLVGREGFSGKEAIAWLRIVRPGSVVGPQQHMLHRLHSALAHTHPGRLASAGGQSATDQLERERPGPRPLGDGVAQAGPMRAAGRDSGAEHLGGWAGNLKPLDAGLGWRRVSSSSTPVTEEAEEEEEGEGEEETGQSQASTHLAASGLPRDSGPASSLGSPTVKAQPAATVPVGGNLSTGLPLGGPPPLPTRSATPTVAEAPGSQCSGSSLLDKLLAIQTADSSASASGPDPGASSSIGVSEH